MSTVLKVVGGIWALLGAGNVLSLMGTDEVSSGVRTFGVIFNFVLFILPGLAVWGIGARVGRSRAEERSLIACPYCAEKIKPEARLCRHCQRELVPLDLKTRA